MIYYFSTKAQTAICRDTHFVTKLSRRASGGAAAAA